MNLDVLQKDLRFAAGIAARRPFNCLIQITNRCNMQCSFCEFWPHPAPRREELTLEELAGIARELRSMGCFLVSLEGGEPLVRKDLADVVRIFSQNHITALFTSGWFVTAQNADALFAAGLTHVSVSIDYPDARRHDQKRGLAGAADRAWRAVETLTRAAPRGGQQVNVMTVVMEDNWRDVEALLQQSAHRGVGHQLTLLSTGGTRRGQRGDAMPPPAAARHLAGLWDRYEHLRFFRDYFERMQPFLQGGSMPTCRAGEQSFNIDHVGNVSSCIERIGEPVGNLRDSTLRELWHRLLGERDAVAACQQCWTACRGLQQAMGGGGALRSWVDMTRRTRSD